MSDGIVLQCTRVDSMRPEYTVDGHGSLEVVCIRCRHRCWLSKVALELVRAEGVKPMCERCKPARAVGRPAIG